MIRNGVIDAQKEFAKKRYEHECDKNFEEIKTKVFEDHKIDIECCRKTYKEAQQYIFGSINGLLIEIYGRSRPHIIRNFGSTNR